MILYNKGGGLSREIPTEADAIDAVRISLLNGKSDVKAKVYKEYPSLRKAANKAKGGEVDFDRDIVIMMGNGQRGGCQNCN